VDGRWAFNNLLAKHDWAWRAEAEVARVGKALVGAYYGKAQDRSYFAGCSDGGRMAGIEVSRFPNEFDGVIMGAPALDFTGLVATLFTWIKNANIGSDGHPILPYRSSSWLRAPSISGAPTRAVWCRGRSNANSITHIPAMQGGGRARMSDFGPGRRAQEMVRRPEEQRRTAALSRRASGRL
jgi:hypothetical protein